MLDYRQSLLAAHHWWLDPEGLSLFFGTLMQVFIFIGTMGAMLVAYYILDNYRKK